MATILLADDESAITMLYEIVLTRMGHRVVVAHNGNEAARIGLDATHAIDVLVTDWRMPGMSGEAVARRLLAARPGMAVILMSGYDEAEQMTKTLDSAHVRFLRKPFSPAVLEQTIHNLSAGLPNGARESARS